MVRLGEPARCVLSHIIRQRSEPSAIPTPYLIDSIKKIIVLGGHKLSCVYLKHILQAQNEGLIQFEEIVYIDENSACQARETFPQIKQIQKTYHDGLKNILNSESFSLDQSILIPDHTAPHVLFRLFLNLIEEKTKIIPFKEDLKLPFQHNAEVSALSYADWTCPMECDEPAICPAINDKRSWHFDRFFREFQNNYQKNFSSHLFFCQQLAYGVAYLPLNLIKDEWEKLRQSLKTQKRFCVATYSKCHGILGIAELI